jgi:sarcosine/dimethylglycine N-methyltransferase
MSTPGPIANVLLYLHPQRVEEELAALGLGAEAALTPNQVASFDQMHYYGNEAVGRASALLGLGPDSRVLDVGSGFGGSARYLAHSIGCRVMAIELQSEIHAAALRLTQRCGLSERVEHICADALLYPLRDAAFDAVVSWLAIVHISERPRLLAQLARALRADGRCYIEDCILRTPSSRKNAHDLKSLLCAPSLSSIADYEADLRSAGFGDIEATDMTEDWAGFVANRLIAFESDRTRYLQVHGAPAYDALHRFYTEVVRFYDSGTLGGVRILARLP